MKWFCYPNMDAIKKIEEENIQKERDARAKATAIKLAAEEQAYRRYIERNE